MIFGRARIIDSIVAKIYDKKSMVRDLNRIR